ncbi:MAG: DUF4230 domain-containing protein [Chloroflexota bacterium]
MTIPTGTNNQPKQSNRIWIILLALFLALALTTLVAPLAVNQVERYLPLFLNTTENLPLTSTPDPIANEWPTPPAGLLVASGLVTDTLDSTPESISPAPVPTLRPTPTIRNLPTPTWEELAYLTSVKMTTSTIVEAKRKTAVPLLGELTTDQILLKAVGNVLLGVDLSRVSNVVVTGRNIRLSLPAPEIVAVELVPEKSQIYESASVLFLTQYDGLETDALTQAQAQLRAEVAGNESMMKLARDMARLQLTEFLEEAGFRSVQIDFPTLNIRNTRG